jgi:hypothetical protein
MMATSPMLQKKAPSLKGILHQENKTKAKQNAIAGRTMATTMTADSA